MLKAFKLFMTVAFVFLAQQGTLCGETQEPNKNKLSANLTLEQAMDSINAKLKTNQDLKPYITVLLNSGTQDQKLAALEKILLQARLPTTDHMQLITYSRYGKIAVTKRSPPF